ncbi:hypothetical protein EVG20_g1 [Dentipellis fragilis]|uniref:Transcription factor domain-containing protein n=1 Tax=Dentipellis fragilis TaxID=205917 RepID=A0A4Y9ZG16_9AGAM|nr:hypothetical protein EVG20_g1 [Dentipellis fragilis]
MGEVMSTPEKRQNLGEIMIESLNPPPAKDSLSEAADSPGPRTQSPWDFLISKLPPDMEDWTAAPMLAIRKLESIYRVDQLSSATRSNMTLEEIISPDQRQYLLKFFDLHYLPWLSLPETDIGNDPFLDLVRCTVASRHLDPLSRTTVAPALHKLTEEAVIRHVFNPCPSPAVVLAFTALALWMPLSKSSTSDTYDNRLIAGAAVNMCISLHMNQASTDVQQLTERIEGGENSPQLQQALAVAEGKLSQWISLHNVEAIVCVGTGRLPSSQLSDLDVRLNRPLSTTSLESARVCRLIVNARIFYITEAGLRLKLQGGANRTEIFYSEVDEVLWRFDGIQRISLPLPIVAEHESFYFHMTIVYYQFCRLLFLTHSLRQMRGLSSIASGKDGFYKLKKNGSSFALRCARDALASSEALLTTICSVPDRTTLATAPDSVFAMITYGAAYVIAAKFMILHTKKVRVLPGSSDELLRRTADILGQISPSPDHHAAHTSHMINSFIDAWKIGLEEDINGESNNSTPAEPTVDQNSPSISGARGGEPNVSGIPNTWMPEEVPAPGIDGLDYLQGLDQDAFLSADFWQFLSGNSMPLPPNPGMPPRYNG